jgi:miniconductance mechanosensitive channel
MDIHDFIKGLVQKLFFILNNPIGLESSLAGYLSELISLVMLFIVSYLVYKITVRLMWGIIIPVLKKSKNQFDDFLVKHHFFRNLAYIVPAFIIYYFVGDISQGMPVVGNIIFSCVELGFVVIAIVVFDSILNTVNDFYNRYDFAKDHPIKSVIQIFKIISYIVGLITIVAILFDKNLGSLVVSLGAVSAVIMLIFKDPILGFVGGLQLIFNKMLAIDDWITMPRFGADGTVTEINLTTVKVQNWDMTIVTIPTYSLVTESFQNWKGMKESGGRRIKRSLFIDVHSVRFCTPEMIAKYQKIQVLTPYINNTEKNITAFNTQHEINPEVTVNGRKQTNIGVFRAYLELYLANRPDINMDMTFMVRQLAPNEKGLPIEVYIFTKTTEWEEYEAVQSDIFDHVLAVVQEFDLKVFQYPTHIISQGL